MILANYLRTISKQCRCQNRSKKLAPPTVYHEPSEAARLLVVLKRVLLKIKELTMLNPALFESKWSTWVIFYLRLRYTKGVKEKILYFENKENVLKFKRPQEVRRILATLKDALLYKFFNRFNIVQSVTIDNYDSDIVLIFVLVTQWKLQYTSTYLTSGYISPLLYVQLKCNSYSVMF